MKENYFTQCFGDQTIILDGAMGTYLRDKVDIGFKTYDFLNSSKPELIESVHREYIDAGAQIITTNTLNANKFTQFNSGDEDKVEELNTLGVAIAKKAIGNLPHVKVAGSIGLSLVEAATPEEIKTAYTPQVIGLIKGGVDLFLIETIYDAARAMEILLVIEEITAEKNISIPVVLSGLPTTMKQIVDHYNLPSSVQAIGINCISPDQDFISHLKHLKKKTKLPILISLNAGLPDMEDNYPLSDLEMLQSVQKIQKEIPLKLIGTCCGSTPAFTKLLVENLS